MAPDDQEYLQRRAEAELECARRASHPAAMRAHYLLLGYYLNKLFPGGDDVKQSRSSLQIVGQTLA
ncbi:hypothetical protein [Sphingomonas sp.]|uniref:hypothetical protein n=1 Tax=Sphingomonas sp. TaxID=28214 RepID=UPI003B3BE3D2